jgi:FixJ family two-component response regulator
LKSTIVIIEDDSLVREGLGDCVESAGYEVKGFESAEEFLASGESETAACLIVDIQLPGMSGLELQGRLAGRRPPLVFVSAQGTRANREKALRQGASGFLSKPFRREDLLKVLGEAMEPRNS